MDKSLCQVESCKNYKKYNRYCIHKVESIKPASTIKKVSDKTADILKKKYNPIARQFIKSHPKCQAKLMNCEGVSSCIHHKAGRIGELLIDTKLFLAVCFSCHRAIEDDPAMAKKKGFSISRLTK
jgi:hypothetical protein